MDSRCNGLKAHEGGAVDLRLQENSPFLGCLSACSTGVNEADNLIDEGIHLVSACQLAGFRHVVGTLWEVSDKRCVDVAKALYEALRGEGMTDGAVCGGLHRAVGALRDGRNERRNVTDESGTARKTYVHHDGKEIVKVNNNISDIVRRDDNPSDAVNENDLQDTTAEDDAPPMAMQIDGRVTREERDAIPLGDKDRKKEQAMSLYWVPYIHFGEDSPRSVRTKSSIFVPNLT